MYWPSNIQLSTSHTTLILWFWSHILLLKEKCVLVSNFPLRHLKCTTRTSKGVLVLPLLLLFFGFGLISFYFKKSASWCPIFTSRHFRCTTSASKVVLVLPLLLLYFELVPYPFTSEKVCPGVQCSPQTPQMHHKHLKGGLSTSYTVLLLCFGFTPNPLALEKLRPGVQFSPQIP